MNEISRVLKSSKKVDAGEPSLMYHCVSCITMTVIGLPEVSSAWSSELQRKCDLQAVQGWGLHVFVRLSSWFEKPVDTAF